MLAGYVSISNQHDVVVESDNDTVRVFSFVFFVLVL
jgi:hypothetical protein